MKKIKIFTPENCSSMHNRTGGLTVEWQVNNWLHDDPRIDIITATPMGEDKLLVIYTVKREEVTPCE